MQCRVTWDAPLHPRGSAKITSNPPTRSKGTNSSRVAISRGSARNSRKPTSSSSSSAAFLPWPFLKRKRRSRRSCAASGAGWQAAGGALGMGQGGARVPVGGRQRAGAPCGRLQRPRPCSATTAGEAGETRQRAPAPPPRATRLLLVELPLWNLLFLLLLARLLLAHLLFNLREGRLGGGGRQSRSLLRSKPSTSGGVCAGLAAQGREGLPRAGPAPCHTRRRSTQPVTQAQAGRQAARAAARITHVQDAILVGPLDEHQEALALGADALAPVPLRRRAQGGRARRVHVLGASKVACSAWGCGLRIKLGCQETKLD